MANQPSFIPSAWAANNSTTETIPATTTESGKASWDQGFPVETSLPLSEGGIPPKYGDFNGILNVLSQFCVFAQAGGQFTWSSTLSYSVGSIVVGSDGSIYRAVQATTNVNPVGDTSGKWERIVSKSDIDDLEEDIQTAMSDAANAVDNASAAQSAVTTLDANVVKLSGAQTIGGTKTFTSGIHGNTSELRVQNDKSGDDGSTSVYGGSNYQTGAYLQTYGKSHSSRPGQFFLVATDGTNTKNFRGNPDGTLQWDGKEFVYTSGNQSVGGVKTFSNAIVASSTAGMRRNVDNSEIRILGGTSFTNCSSLILYGNAASGGNAGTFRVRSQDGTTNKDLIGKTDGTLTWDGKGFVYDSGDQTVGGAKTFSTGVTISAVAAIKRDVNNSHITVYGCNGYGNGAYLILSGKNEETDAGRFNLRASNGTNSKDLTGKPDGTLTWNGQPVQTTSDERLKTPLVDVPDAVLDAWGDVGWGQFQYLDAVEKKGVDKARLHLGLIAQRVKAVFEERGLDACKYGILCHEEYPATDEEPAVDLWMVRYTEASAMEAAYQRRRADRADARITALEQRLAEMEAVLASLMPPVGDETYAEYAEPELEQDAEQEGEE